ncbi:MAG: TerC/Alx family metal homeostasis membrane protein [Bacteroidia bacterium]|nr:TerC/Alx family metal homeostasis membrane protein [Bacteroidia bacterium]MCO5254648.1 TerC/Alx family metal homeostasis membrane protein [Bacteroidota bacterium]
MTAETIFFICFLILIIGILVFDMGVLNREKHEVSFKEALVWTSVWFGLAMIFYIFLRYYAYMIHGVTDIAGLQRINELYAHKLNLTGTNYAADLNTYNKTVSLQYLTGFFIEYSLSIDNLFVMLLIFKSFNVEKKYYKTVLEWGILGAIIMRFVFIFAGAALVSKFHWILYVFGAILVFSGIKMFIDQMKKKDEDVSVKRGMAGFVSKFIAVFPKNVGGHIGFRHKGHGKFYFTPLFIVILVIEFSDLLFAIDSVPAIFAVTLDPYTIFFANIFAILGLRSLFFLLAYFVNIFHLLGYGLSVLLTFIGTKLIFADWFEQIGINSTVSLFIILGIIIIAIFASLIFPKKTAITDSINGVE